MRSTTTIRARTTAFLCLVCVLSTVPASSAHASGFYLFDRGVQPNGRAGAFVAGAQGVYSLWYNPAGLRFGGRRELLANIALARLSAGTSFTRTNESGTLPTVHSQQQFIPIPSIGYSDTFGTRHWSFGILFDAPSVVVQKWPFDLGGSPPTPAPQRYSLYSLNKTTLSELSVGTAYEPIRGLSFGVALGVHMAKVQLQNAVSACVPGICPAVEDPAYDSYVKITTPTLFAPLGNIGVTYRHPRWFSIGASFMTPYKFHDSSARLDTTLPSAPVFSGATVEHRGGGAPTVDAELKFPWIVRGGVEVRPIERLRIETAVVVEGWSRDKQIAITPNDVVVTGGVVGSLPAAYNTIIPTTIPRNGKNTVSVRVGGEYVGRWFEARVGVAYETHVFSNAYLQPLTMDSNKTTVAGGLSLRPMPSLSLDATFAWAFMQSRTVTNSQVLQPVAVEPAAAGAVPIGNGRYEMGGYYVAVGLRWRPEGRRHHAAQPQPEPQPLPSAPTEPPPPVTTTIEPSPMRSFPSQTAPSQTAPAQTAPAQGAPATGQ